MFQMDKSKRLRDLTKEELVDICLDSTAPPEIRDKAWAEAERRRLATMHERHSADDQPEM